MSALDTAALRAREVHYSRANDPGVVIITEAERDALCDAADEVERLRVWRDDGWTAERAARAERDASRAEVERLRADYAALAKHDDEYASSAVATIVRLKAERDAAGHVGCDSDCDHCYALSELARERDASRTAHAALVADLRALHRPTAAVDHGAEYDACVTCFDEYERPTAWPCPTAALLDRHAPTTGATP